MTTRRVMLLPRYPDVAASARLRFSQFVPVLQAAGLECRSFPFYAPNYVEGRFGGSLSRLSALVQALARRLRVAVLARRDEVAYAQFELLPFLPPGLEAWMASRYRRVVVDFDDAWFHLYDQHPNRLIRRMFSRKLPRLLSRADAVVVGSAYLREYAERHAARVEFVPTCVDLERYPPPHGRRAGTARPFRICWIGSQTTSVYLKMIEEPIARFCRRTGARLRVIGAHGTGNLAGPHVEHVPWSEQDEVQRITECDVGVMPMPDDPWTRGKCGYKLIQYMACGLATVASPVGENPVVVDQGGCGVLATTADEWFEALTRLYEDERLRTELGRLGRTRVVEHYSVQRWGRVLAAVLSGA